MAWREASGMKGMAMPFSARAPAVDVTATSTKNAACTICLMFFALFFFNSALFVVIVPP